VLGERILLAIAGLILILIGVGVVHALYRHQPADTVGWLLALTLIFLAVLSVSAGIITLFLGAFAKL
jgi:hypothetical protein